MTEEPEYMLEHHGIATARGIEKARPEKVIGQLADQSDAAEKLSSESLIRQALQAMSGGSR